MARTISPLRYPGGKASLLELTIDLLNMNDLQYGHYAEPYAGGCGLALALLFEGHVSDIHVNDIDPAVWAFWFSVLHEIDAFIDLVSKVEISIEEWDRQRETHQRCDHSDLLRLGFSAFYLNRTNRSGIISGAGVIGGRAQLGNFKMGCRFNRGDLIRRLRRVWKYRNRIHLTCLDAQEYIALQTKRLPRKSLFFIDPPYYSKGAELYTSFYRPEDHQDVAMDVLGIRQPWVVTYDDVDPIRQVYVSNRQYSLSVAYSLREKRRADELMIVSKNMFVPDRLSMINGDADRS